MNRRTTICLNMIIKNEGKIISRLLDSVISIIDCYCICDTGSTDNTVEIISNYFLDKNIDGKIIHEAFRNFEYNRNIALKECIGMSDYILLLDADMTVYLGESFNKSNLTSDYYYLLQGNEDFYYQNVRLVKNNGQYKYVGVTHEYLDTPCNTSSGLLEKDELFIYDLGDGGCKTNKIERDIRLLEDAIGSEPDNSRYYFYLANSYRDGMMYIDAIDKYKKVLELNGWIQEKYCSCLYIGNCYKVLEDYDLAIRYWLKTIEYDSDRIDAIVETTTYLRENNEHIMVNLLYHKFKYYNKDIPSDKLFLDRTKYRDMLEYNNSISAYYCDDLDSGYDCCKIILCNCLLPVDLLFFTILNLDFYKEYLYTDEKEEIIEIYESVDHLMSTYQGSQEITELHHEIKNLLLELSRI